MIGKDAKKAIGKPSDHSRNCLSLEGTEFLLHTYKFRRSVQYTTVWKLRPYLLLNLMLLLVLFFLTVFCGFLFCADNADTIVHPAGR